MNCFSVFAGICMENTIRFKAFNQTTNFSNDLKALSMKTRDPVAVKHVRREMKMTSDRETMFQPPAWRTPAPLQPEPAPSESPDAVENIRPGPTGLEKMSNSTGWLQAIALTYHEGQALVHLGQAQIQFLPSVCRQSWGSQHLNSNNFFSASEQNREVNKEMN